VSQCRDDKVEESAGIDAVVGEAERDQICGSDEERSLEWGRR